MPEKKRPSGPFFEEEMIFRLEEREGRRTRIPVALPYEVMSDEQVEELVDLLNKGTHADQLATVLRSWQWAYQDSSLLENTAYGASKRLQLNRVADEVLRKYWGGERHDRPE